MKMPVHWEQRSVGAKKGEGVTVTTTDKSVVV